MLWIAHFVIQFTVKFIEQLSIGQIKESVSKILKSIKALKKFDQNNIHVVENIDSLHMGIIKLINYNRCIGVCNIRKVTKYEFLLRVPLNKLTYWVSEGKCLQGI